MPNAQLENLRLLAETNRWLAVYPELALVLLALAVLVLDLFLPRKLHALIPGWALLGQVLLLGVVVADYTFGDRLTAQLGMTSFGDLIRHTPVGEFFRCFFLLTSIAVTQIAMVSFDKHAEAPRSEYLHIVLIATAAMMLLAQSNNFLLLFVALETVTVCLYVLVSYFRNSAATLEAGLKYLVMGGLSSALLLFGIVLLYGAAGSASLAASTADGMDFGALSRFLMENPSHPLVIGGVALVLTGVFFKIGAFPFQMWVPDVYQGAPTPTTGLLAIASKGAGFAVLMLLVMGPFATLSPQLAKVLGAVGAGSILFGNFAALTQRNVKRLIGLSGVSHAGFLLLGVAAFAALREPLTMGWSEGQLLALGALALYLTGYLVASVAVFSVMAHVARRDDSVQELEHYDDLSRKQPFLAGVLAIGLGSLAGIPPTVGFIGKALIFLAVFKAGMYWMLAVAVLGVIVSIYYYFGWIKAAWFDTWKLPPVEGEAVAVEEVTSPTLSTRLSLYLVCALTLLLGIAQWPLKGLLD